MDSNQVCQPGESSRAERSDESYGNRMPPAGGASARRYITAYRRAGLDNQTARGRVDLGTKSTSFGNQSTAANSDLRVLRPSREGCPGSNQSQISRRESEAARCERDKPARAVFQERRDVWTGFPPSWTSRSSRSRRGGRVWVQLEPIAPAAAAARAPLRPQSEWSCCRPPAVQPLYFFSGRLFGAVASTQYHLVMYGDFQPSIATNLRDLELPED